MHLKGKAVIQIIDSMKRKVLNVLHFLKLFIIRLQWSSGHITFIDWMNIQVLNIVSVFSQIPIHGYGCSGVRLSSKDASNPTQLEEPLKELEPVAV